MWDFLYKVAADVPDSPAPKTVRQYYDFFKTLATTIPSTEDRRAYRKLISSGPFKLQSKHFEQGPQHALQWIMDVRQGIRLHQGKTVCDSDSSTLWKKLRFERSNRHPQSPQWNEESLDVATLNSTRSLEKYTNSGKLTVILFDKPHYLLLVPGRSDKKARLDLASMRARFDVDAVWVPGNISYRWWFSIPGSTSWKERTSWKFPLFRVYKNGKIIVESNESEDIKRYLKQRAMKNAPIRYISHDNNRAKTPPKKGALNSFKHGFANSLGRRAAQAQLPSMYSSLF